MKSVSNLSICLATLLLLNLNACNKANEKVGRDSQIQNKPNSASDSTSPNDTISQQVNKLKESSIAGKTMGTTYSIKWVDSSSSEKQQTSSIIQGKIEAKLAQINKAMSTYDPESEISKLNKQPKGVYSISEHFYNTIVIANTVSTETDGAFDATVSPLINLWGFGHKGTVTKQPNSKDIEQAKQRIGFEKLVIHPDTNQVEKLADITLNLSAVAKGYAVDMLAQTLEDSGIENYFVEIGGEVVAKGNKANGDSWKVGIEKPTINARKIQEVLNVSNTAIATSGDYRNYFEENGVRFSHTINPETGRPINHKLASVSVLKKTCAEADAYATALMVMGDKKGVEFAKQHKIDALFLVKSQDGFEGITTGNFAERLLPKD